jgi:hypothetical protein
MGKGWGGSRLRRPRVILNFTCSSHFGSRMRYKVLQMSFLLCAMLTNTKPIPCPSHHSKSKPPLLYFPLPYLGKEVPAQHATLSRAMTLDRRDAVAMSTMHDITTHDAC